MDKDSVMERNIEKVWKVLTRRGGGSHLQVGQVLPPGNWKEFDPFLMMAEDWFQQGTFPNHPHRGMETITYVIEGKLQHEDNHGGSGVLEAGDVQWMTAGNGIVHSEDPLQGETVHSLQLWLNLPRSLKRVEPRYQDLNANAVPIRKEDGVTVRVFSGTSGDIKSSTKNYVPVTYLDIEIEAGATLSQELPGSYNGFIYVLQGSGQFGKEKVHGVKNQVLWLGSGNELSKSKVSVQADEKLRLLLIAGEPIGEPVVAGGPFVMNTEDEIREAFRDYQLGKF